MSNTLPRGWSAPAVLQEAVLKSTLLPRDRRRPQPRLFSEPHVLTRTAGPAHQSPSREPGIRVISLCPPCKWRVPLLGHRGCRGAHLIGGTKERTLKQEAQGSGDTCRPREMAELARLPVCSMAPTSCFQNLLLGPAGPHVPPWGAGEAAASLRGGGGQLSSSDSARMGFTSLESQEPSLSSSSFVALDRNSRHPSGLRQRLRISSRGPDGRRVHHDGAASQGSRAHLPPRPTLHVDRDNVLVS